MTSSSSVNQGSVNMRSFVRLRLRSMAFAMILGSLPVGPGALAQVRPEGTTDPDAGVRAEDALKKGIEAYRKGKYDVARASLETAWSAKRSGSVAAMLAEVEMELGSYDRAATHWAYAVYHLPAAATDALAEARGKLEECKKHVGTFIIEVIPPEAEVFVEGQPSDFREQGNQIWVLPGAHTLTARAAGVTDEVRIQIDAGETKTVHLRAAAEPPPRPPTPAPVAVELRSTPDARSGLQTRTVVTLAGAGASLVALGFGVGFALHRSALSGDIDALDERLRKRAPDAEPYSLCAGDAPAACDQRMGKITDYNRASVRANVAFALSAGLGVATALTYVFWPSRSAKDSVENGATTAAKTSARRFAVVPTFSPGYQGLELQMGY